MISNILQSLHSVILTKLLEHLMWPSICTAHMLRPPALSRATLILHYPHHSAPKCAKPKHGKTRGGHSWAKRLPLPAACPAQSSCPELPLSPHRSQAKAPWVEGGGQWASFANQPPILGDACVFFRVASLHRVLGQLGEHDPLLPLTFRGSVCLFTSAFLQKAPFK